MVTNDTVRTATIMSIIGSIQSILKLVIGPYVGSLSDRIGRRPFLMITPPIWALTRLAVVAKPSVLTVALSRTMGHALFDSFQTVAEASLMDLHQGDSAGLSKSLSSLGQGIALAVLIGKLGGVLVHTECFCCQVLLWVAI